MKIIDKLNFDGKGLIPTVIQDCRSGKVLTLCYMNKEALEKTQEKGKIYVFRRSKQKVMMKGETSGCTQVVKEVFVDCENNSLLFRVEQKDVACHTGNFSCYYTKIDKGGNVLSE